MTTVTKSKTLYAVPAHLKAHYAGAVVTVPSLRGDAEREWATRYVRDAYDLGFIGADPETNTLVNGVIGDPAELDRYITHVLKLEAAWHEHTRPAREAEEEARRQYAEAADACPCCGEVNGHRPRERGHDVCDQCDMVVNWLLMRAAANPNRIAAVESLLSL